jgi:hypothetical protein
MAQVFTVCPVLEVADLVRNGTSIVNCRQSGAAGIGFCSRFRIKYDDDGTLLALPIMSDEHDVPILLFDFGEKDPMLVRGNR